MMGKLFCLPAFGRKGKASKTVIPTNLKKDPESLDMELIKKDAASNLPLFAKDMIVSCGADSPAPKKGIFARDSEAGEIGSPVKKSLPCKLQIETFQQSPASVFASSHVPMGQQDMLTEEVSMHAKGALNYEMGSQEILTPHSPQLGCGSYGGYKSDSDAMGSECTRQSCTDSSSLLRKGIAFPVADAEAMEKGIFGGMHLFVGQEEGRRDAIFRYSPDKAISSIKKFGLDDAMLGGHISDPGVYQGEELQSSTGFSVLQDDGSVMHSLQMEGSPNPDSRSHVSGDAAENFSVVTCGPCSEPTYQMVEIVDPRPDSMSVGCLSSPLDARLIPEASDNVLVYEAMFEQQHKGYSSDLGEGKNHLYKMTRNLQKLKGKADNAAEEAEGIFTVALRPQSLITHTPTHQSSFSRVKEWISTIQQPDLTLSEQPTSEIIEEIAEASGGLPEAASMDRDLASAAVRSLSVYSTVAHMAGIGLHEVPSLGVYNCLKTLNLSANSIARVLAGCLPQSLHTLDLSRNRISQIEGFRELTRLRVLNLSHNRISRVGHGLGNCTLIKELYLAGNKIAEVDGLHRLLKLSVLDLSHNKIATSKALGQLAANYSSLLALNLMGNPILVNVGEDQLRKLVCSLTPHVTYLNKQPIKAVSVREAVVDNVARAALGTSHRNSKASRKVAGVQSSATTQKKLPSRRAKDAEKRQGSNPGRSSRQHHNHGHYSRDSIGMQLNEKGLGKEQGNSSGTPLHDHLVRNLARDTMGQSMHRSRSDGTLQEEE